MVYKSGSHSEIYCCDFLPSFSCYIIILGTVMMNPRMGRWLGRIALVTGASTGIGAAVCKELVKQGMKVVGCAREYEKIEEILKSEELINAPGELIPMKCDLLKEKDIYKMFGDIRSRFGRLDVCINNAGFTKNSPLLTAKRAKDWRNILEVNVIALSICSREAATLMKDKKINDGQIIQIDCITGRKFPELALPGLDFFCATKSAVQTLTEGLRREIRKGSSVPHVRVASVTPGAVETEFAERSINPETARALYSKVKCLQPQDVAEAVLFILKSPAHVEVNDIVLQPVEYTI